MCCPLYPQIPDLWLLVNTSHSRTAGPSIYRAENINKYLLSSISLPKEAMPNILSPLKIHRPQPSLNHRTSDIVGSTDEDDHI